MTLQISWDSPCNCLILFYFCPFLDLTSISPFSSFLLFNSHFPLLSLPPVNTFSPPSSDVCRHSLPPSGVGGGGFLQYQYIQLWWVTVNPHLKRCSMALGWTSKPSMSLHAYKVGLHGRRWSLHGFRVNLHSSKVRLSPVRVSHHAPEWASRVPKWALTTPGWSVRPTLFFALKNTRLPSGIICDLSGSILNADPTRPDQKHCTVSRYYYSTQ